MCLQWSLGKEIWIQSKKGKASLYSWGLSPGAQCQDAPSMGDIQSLKSEGHIQSSMCEKPTDYIAATTSHEIMCHPSYFPHLGNPLLNVWTTWCNSHAFLLQILHGLAPVASLEMATRKVSALNQAAKQIQDSINNGRAWFLSPWLPGLQNSSPGQKTLFLRQRGGGEMSQTR